MRLTALNPAVSVMPSEVEAVYIDREIVKVRMKSGVVVDHESDAKVGVYRAKDLLVAQINEALQP